MDDSTNPIVMNCINCQQDNQNVQEKRDIDIKYWKVN